MKGIILAVVGILLLAGAAGGGYFAYKKYIAPPPEEAAAPVKTKPAPGPPPTYVRLPRLEIPVIGKDRPEQLITIVIALEVRDQSAAEYLSPRLPRLTDTFMTALYAAIDEGEMTNGSLVNVVRIKKRLQAAANRLLGDDVVKDVLIQTVLQRRL